MNQYSEKDTNQMSWNEFDQLIDTLISKINAHFRDQKVNVVAQLHRTGGIVGSVLAIKMGIIPLLPLQFKYFYNPTKIVQITSVPDLLVDVPENMNVILAEGNTGTGSVAKEAAKAIKSKYPRAKIYLATLCKVYGGFEKLDGIEEVFYGTLTDEKFQASDEEGKRLGIRPKITIFPWENMKDELSDINSA